MNYTDFNSYLFYEFGYSDESDESKVSGTWPFSFAHITDFQINGKKTSILEFSDDGEDFYLVSNGSLTFYEKEGMDLVALELFLSGSSWIGCRNPIDLNTMDTRPPKIPSIPERKDRFNELGRDTLNSESFQILEGLYLKETREHLGLAQSSESKKNGIF